MERRRVYNLLQTNTFLRIVCFDSTPTFSDTLKSKIEVLNRTSPNVMCLSFYLRMAFNVSEFQPDRSLCQQHSGPSPPNYMQCLPAYPYQPLAQNSNDLTYYVPVRLMTAPGHRHCWKALTSHCSVQTQSVVQTLQYHKYLLVYVKRVIEFY